MFPAIWVPILLGWPAVAASIVTTLVAIVRGSSRLAVVGACLALPFMLYLFAAPRFRLLAPPVFGLHLLSAYALRRGSRLAAVVLVLPFAGLALLVARLVLSQGS